MHVSRQSRKRAARVRRREHRAIKQRRPAELIHRIRPERMDLRNLPGHLRLVALYVERRAQRTGKRRLKSVVPQYPDISSVARPERMVYSPRPLILLIRVRWRAPEFNRTGRAGGQKIARKPSTSSVRHWNRCARTGSVVV